MAIFKNLSDGCLSVMKKVEGRYVPTLVEVGGIVELSKDEIKKLKESFRYSDWFENGFLVEVEKMSESEETTLTSLQELAKAPIAKFRKEVKKIKSYEALKELKSLVTTPIKLEIVEKLLDGFNVTQSADLVENT